MIIRRNADFVTTYFDTISRFPDMMVYDAITIALHTPAREFYISEAQALRFCYQLAKRRKISLKRGTDKYQCVMSLYYMARVKAQSRNIPLRQAVIETLYAPAPRFYMNRSTAYAIIKKHR